MSQWEDVYDRQMALWSYWHSRDGAAFARGYAKSIGEKEGGARADFVKHLDAMEATAAFIAEPISVSREMAMLARVASETFEPEPLQPQDLLTDAGFVWLPEPWEFIDRHRKRVAFRGILWAPLYQRPEEPGAAIEVQPEARPMAVPLDDKRHEGMPLAGITMGFYSYYTDADDYWTADKVAIARDHHPMALSHITPWIFGDGYNAPGPGSAYGMARLVQTLFRLMQQTIAIQGRNPLSRPARRRAKRNNWPEKRVTVITLRRPRQPTPDDHEPKAIDWSHRWLVAGHWRNQWFPSLALHRQIWIHPYVKGPEDRPLELRKLRAFVLSR